MEENDIELVMQQANVSRSKVSLCLWNIPQIVSCSCSSFETSTSSNVCVVRFVVLNLIHLSCPLQAVMALRNNDNDIVNAIMVGILISRFSMIFFWTVLHFLCD